MRLQKGNRKLPKETLIWNLPSGKTCPAATKECLKHCYAKKAERMYPQVLPFRERNFQISKDKNFVEIISQEIYNSKNCNTIRFHESGDIYNNTYYKKLIDIANLFPEKIFYCYTKIKSTLNIIKPKNFIVILSDDNKKYSIKDIKNMKFNGVARVVDKKYKIKKGEFLCPGSCKKCNYCYSGKRFKKIIFEKH